MAAPQFVKKASQSLNVFSGGKGIFQLADLYFDEIEDEKRRRPFNAIKIITIIIIVIDRPNFPAYNEINQNKGGVQHGKNDLQRLRLRL
jgi:hypothetical protein